MDNYVFIPNGVCSRKISFDLDDQKSIHNLRFEYGCNGNLKAIGILAEGRPAKEVADLLRGNLCEGKGTSCCDQLARALDNALADDME